MILHPEGPSLQKRQRHTIAILGGFAIASVGIGRPLGVKAPFFGRHWHSLGDVEANRRSCGQQEIGGGAMWGANCRWPKIRLWCAVGKKVVTKV